MKFRNKRAGKQQQKNRKTKQRFVNTPSALIHVIVTCAETKILELINITHTPWQFVFQLHSGSGEKHSTTARVSLNSLFAPKALLACFTTEQNTVKASLFVKSWML